MVTRGVLPLLFLFAACGIVSCNEDEGFLPEELAQTMARLSSTRRGPFKSKTATDPARTTSFLAIPTAAYANAYADMRSPPAAALPNPFASGIAGMKNLPFPSFALQQVVSAEHGPSQPRPRASVTMADLRTNHYHSGDHAAVGGIKLGIPYALLKASSTPQARFTTSKLLASSQQASSSPGATAAQADSVLKELAGIHTATGGPRPLGLAELSLDTASDAKGQAMTRIATKYAHTAMHVAKTMTDPLNGPRDDEVAVSPAKGSGGLDSSVKSYHGYLATAVMILASLTGAAICGGICAVTYCYAKREKALSDVGQDGQRGEKKYYGRPTAQYGSYGRAR